MIQEKRFLIAVFLLLMGITVLTHFLIQSEEQLSDCQFECNHLQAKLDRYEELNDYIPALNQLLPPLAMAELKVATLQFRDQRHLAYEGQELPLING